MHNRRNFIKLSTMAGLGTFLSSCFSVDKNHSYKKKRPIVLSTWRFGIEANAKAWDILSKNGRTLNAVEHGVKFVENNPKERSVGYGGRPDRDGKVTLYACIMDENANIGSVAALEHIKYPISVDRAVMEKTPHVMLVGNGAFQFALSQGFKKENLLTEENEKEWERMAKKHPIPTCCKH